ncbi:SF3a splicing factor complex subunit [Oleoguttula sp. CCFEE 5521]
MAATTDGDANMEDLTSRAPPGTILPPPELRKVLEKTAGYVARNGDRFETVIRDKQGSEAKMSFINPDDAYHAYYRWRVEEIKAGRGNAVSAGREGEVSFQGREVRKGPEKPEDFQFSARMPVFSALDLDVVKLTALFTAKNGKGWATHLYQRESGSSQFDFLRPQHTMNQYFMRLVEQYQDLLTGDAVDGGRPQKKRVAQLEENVQDRFKVLERARKRAEWVKHQEQQKVAQEEQAEKEKVEFAQIDWHSFVVVETIVFDERDEQVELPPPITQNDLQSASLEQKAAMSINPNRRLEEAFPSTDDYNTFYDQAAQAPQAAQQYYQPQAYTPIPPTPSMAPPPHRPQPVQPTASTPLNLRPSAPMPRALARNPQVPTSICPNCRLPIPNDEMAEHIKIEMLSPEWREQSARAAHRSSTTNLSTGAVAENLKRLARKRGDVFEDVAGRGVAEEEAEEERRKRVATEAAVQQGQAGGNVEDQIRSLHERYKG